MYMERAKSILDEYTDTCKRRKKVLEKKVRKLEEDFYAEVRLKNYYILSLICFEKDWPSHDGQR